jgi:predicted acylesterase/phospholipase RssA
MVFTSLRRRRRPCPVPPGIVTSDATPPHSPVDFPGGARFRPWLRAGAILLLALAVVAGCKAPTAETNPPQTPVNPIARALAPPEPPRVVPAGVTLSSPPEPGEGMRPPRHVLALSSGGLYGAYSSGFLAGWTQSGTRPEFDVVTGVSTGSLIAPLAFLGPEFDDRMQELYTGIRAEDVFKIRAWVTIPFKDAVASSAPLRKLIDSQVTPDLMKWVASEHRKGRRLYVGTTNLNTRRLVVWDMGAIASRPCPEGCHLFRDVLLASCSVPGMLPPVPFQVQSGGETVTELHADGGVSSQIFVPPAVFQAARGGDSRAAGSNGNLYAVVSGKLYPDATPVKQRVLPILGATTGTIMYAHCRAELMSLYGQAKLAGLKYHLTALRQDLMVNVDTSLTFDREEMTRLYAEGVRDGLGGPNWRYDPSDIAPGADVRVK